MNESILDFPNNGLLPKKETGALSFLSKHANYDGRGIVIAVLDTGVDPAAAGLQMTSDSKHKIIDLYDATGAGNVDISTELRPDSDRYLVGLTGRKLKVPSYWLNPSGKFYCGVKALFELCSATLRQRIRKERKEKLWQPFNDEAIVQVQKKLNDLANNQKADWPSSSSGTGAAALSRGSSEDSSPSTVSVLSTSKPTDNDLINTLTKEDLQAQLEVLKDLENKVKDVGPVYDCLVWNDGDAWRACIDTTEVGDLENCKVLTNYKDSHEYGTFSYMDMLNYTVRILPDENILQIVTDSGSHGTHVAAIATGFYADKPELNGIAPGAQIISVKIGDNRLNGMETGFALVNACRYIIENNCDLVNYSFGEPINYCNPGPNLFFAQELIDTYGVILCASAGNDGPGIETVGAPGGFGSAAISVGAYVSNDMLKAEHSLLGNGSSMLFTWSSRGPQLDGHLGVSVCAPGGAFADVPNWTQRGTQLMSGTSMSSPNCSGCLALILSGLKDNKIEFNPFGIKRAIENTALQVDETLGSGAGLIQVEKAYEYMVEYKDSLFQKIHFDVKYSSKSKQFRGIYLKECDELTETRDYLVTVEPKFFENKLKTALSKEKQLNLNDKDLLEAQKDKLALNKKLALVCDNNDCGNQWIEYPPHLYIVNSSRNFHIRIRAGELAEGSVYFTQIKAYDIDDPNKTCLFKIPITVVKPHTFDSNKKGVHDYQLKFQNVPFKQGQIYRHFFRAPHGATHAELILNCDSKVNRDHTPLFYVQTFTLNHFRSQTDAAKEEAYRLNTSNQLNHLFKVQSNKIVQVCIAKNWSNIGHVLADYQIKFSGLYPKNASEISCLSSQPLRLEVGSYLREEECDPVVQWKHHIQPLKPSENVIENVKSSYGLIKPIYQIVLTYKFSQSKTDEVCCEVPLLSHHLYENEYQSIFWMLFEATSKRFIVAGDAFPILYKYASSIEKGDYIVKLHVRHESIELLEKLKDLSLYVRHTLTGTLNQDIYLNHIGLLKGSGKKSGNERILINNESVYYLNTIPDDKLPKGIANGHFLTGYISFFKDPKKSQVDKHKIFYHINNFSNSKKNEKTLIKQSKSQVDTQELSTAVSTVTSITTSSLSSLTSPNNTLNQQEEDKFKEALRDTKVAWILKSNQVFESVRDEHENHIPVYLNRIQYLQQKLSTTPNENEKSSLNEEIIELCKQAIGKIDQNDLLRYIGEKYHEAVTEETKKDYENRKSYMIELLINQGLAMIEMNNLNKNQVVSISLTNDLKAIYRTIQKWIDISDEKVSKFINKFLMNQKFYGKALKNLFKQLEDKQYINANDQAILNILKQMDLQYAVKFFENHLIMKYPKKFAVY